MHLLHPVSRSIFLPLIHAPPSLFQGTLIFYLTSLDPCRRGFPTCLDIHLSSLDPRAATVFSRNLNLLSFVPSTTRHGCFSISSCNLSTLPRSMRQCSFPSHPNLSSLPESSRHRAFFISSRGLSSFFSSPSCRNISFSSRGISSFAPTHIVARFPSCVAFNLLSLNLAHILLFHF
jgi:hypothetical protein